MTELEAVQSWGGFDETGKDRNSAQQSRRPRAASAATGIAALARKEASTDHAFLAELRTARTDRPARGTAPMRTLVVSFLFQQNQN